MSYFVAVGAFFAAALLLAVVRLTRSSLTGRRDDLPVLELTGREDPRYVPPPVPTRQVSLQYLRPDDDDEAVESLEVLVAGINHMGHCGIHRQTMLGHCEPGEEIVLIREPDNAHDEHAVCCFRTSGQDIGYLPSYVAEEVAPFLDGGHTVLARIIEVEAFITDAGKRLLGARLELTFYRSRRQEARSS